jgi:hypothetical protein
VINRPDGGCGMIASGGWAVEHRTRGRSVPLPRPIPSVHVHPCTVSSQQNAPRSRYTGLWCLHHALHHSSLIARSSPFGGLPLCCVVAKHGTARVLRRPMRRSRCHSPGGNAPTRAEGRVRKPTKASVPSTARSAQPLGDIADMDLAINT